MTKYPVRIECSDGVIRDGYQIVLDNDAIVLRTTKGAAPNSFGPPKQRTWAEVKGDHSHDDKWDIRLSGSRDRYGKDGLDRQPK